VVNIIFNKKSLSKWNVNLSIGKVFFKKITHRIRNKIEVASQGDISLMYRLYEYTLLNLSNRKIDNLTIEDSDKLRNKVKEILIHYKIIIIVKNEPKNDLDIFSKSDIKWFDKTRNVMKSKLKSGNNGR